MQTDRPMKVPALLFLFLFMATFTQSGPVIAHRGASFEAPENTFAALNLAIEKGADIVEFDVMETRDNALILFHDRDLKRICGVEGRLGDLTREEAVLLDVGSWFDEDFRNERPPTLEAAIKFCLENGAVPLIERKTGSPEEYAKVLAELKATPDVIVQSFDWEFIRALKVLLPGLRTGALGSGELSDRKAELLKLQPDWVGWHADDLTRKDVEWLGRKGFLRAVWTVNDPEKARVLTEWGVDRIITDRPAFIAEKLGRP